MTSPTYTGEFAVAESSEDSFASLSVSGSGLTLWSENQAMEGQTAAERRLRLAPGSVAIVGRQDGGRIEYLDTRYAPTRVVPGTGQPVLTSLGKGQDMYVSRGHFTLRGTAQGIVLVNGVPRPGGGTRPPRNGTYMVAPQHRPMLRGEEYLIERGQTVTISLPNYTTISIRAE